MLLKILKILKKHIIGHKCPSDIFKGPRTSPKNTHFNGRSPSHHKWCDIFKTHDLPFFKFSQNQTSVVKCKMDIFKNEKCPS